MERFAISVLWLTALALPVIVFLLFRPRSHLRCLFAAIAAVATGWSFNFAYAIAAQAITAKDVSGINGAAHAFAALFGWVLPTFLVLLTWLAWGFIARRMSPNNSFKPTPLRGAA
ncbi:hypothetical protein [Pseudoxanthomonas wuyuanensis]|uniref:Uncharacterized protein n=1 Tax=Pseudoxanthomonas wuyuanensis TaxID=1073196 RepID=A0A286CV38_9GAMM|nr:hypothetical protein [Pseudoxanthomonas wuyuanensis]KAF1714461.1 hypothetical protein CSC75_20180 [Pseudoxanthomonas wuyuanensis]SOD50215.1 hypothetical protein SAMN06296416_1011 [Pseudoxanthomonas wuyuanensis]